MEKEKYTKYEKARMLGSRTLQIAMGAPFLVKLTKEDLESMNYDAFKIAKREFDEGVMPISVTRPMPQPDMPEPKKEAKAAE
ncbi:MAG: DNA-directed RNA polymerase subunit K [Candidatus Woesearchaeota archaeon]|nr:DNA-directed RNA polymerase subunit K [Candidatus Woesearchaeota archaeon]